MYQEYAVRVPDVPGKIVTRTVGKSTYVLLETGRIYHPDSKTTKPERVEIGRVIQGHPELMLPNDNYAMYFPEETGKLTKEELAEIGEDLNLKEDALRKWNEDRAWGRMLRDFFEKTYYEFQALNRKNPNEVVNAEKVRRLNMILEPLMEMMKDEPYAMYLMLIPEPTEEVVEEWAEEDGMMLADRNDRPEESAGRNDRPEESADRNGRDSPSVPDRNGKGHPFVPALCSERSQRRKRKKTRLMGLTYGDVGLYLAQFKSAVNQYFMKMI